MHRLLAALLISAAPAAALAQSASSPPACETISDVDLPAGLSAWTRRAPMAAAVAGSNLADASLPIGQGIDAQLKPAGQVSFPALPTKPGPATSYGGLYGFAIDEEGDYQVSLGAGAWIEVVSGGAFVAATSHAHGPACSSLRKAVVFPLKAGRYMLEITGNRESVLPVMITRALN